MVAVPGVADDLPERSHNVIMTDEDDMGAIMAGKADLLQTLADKKSLGSDADEGGYVIKNNSTYRGCRHLTDADKGEGQNDMEEDGTGYPRDDKLGTYEMLMDDDIIGIDTNQVTKIENRPIGEFMIQQDGEVMGELFKTPVKEHEQVDGKHINGL